MDIICSKTGSDGNFSVISDGESSIVIDCGIDYQKANKMARYTLIDASGVLVTHSHK